MKKIVKYIVSLSVILAASCSDVSHEAFNNAPRGTISIAHLKTLCRDGSTTITDDISIEGYVVANDLFGEYQKAIILCDESGGIELSLDCNSTATRFPISARVVIHCTGLAIGKYGGRLILGAAPSGDYTVDRIAEKDFALYIHVDTSRPKEIKPKQTKIDNISTNDIGNYIALNDVTFGNEAGLKWCDVDSESGKYISTVRTLYDKSGSSLQVRTIADCHYRSEEIPSDYGSVWGIVEYFNDSYSLRIINHRIEF